MSFTISGIPHTQNPPWRDACCKGFVYFGCSYLSRDDGCRPSIHEGYMAWAAGALPAAVLAIYHWHRAFAGGVAGKVLQVCASSWEQG
jgi:hypothetical protein